MTTITFTDKHLLVIEQALEVYNRLRLGQIKIALDEAFPDKHLDYDAGNALEKEVRKVIFPELTDSRASYGVGQHKGNGEIAYEIRQTLRQYISVKNNDGYFDHSFRNFDDPLKLSEEPLPIIEGFDKSKTFVIKGKKTNDRLHTLIEAKDFTQLWKEIDKYFQDAMPKCSQSKIVYNEETGNHELICTKAYKDMTLKHL